MQTASFFHSSGLGMRDPRCVSIALGDPAHYHGRRYQKLVPPGDLLRRYHNRKMTDDLYAVEYIARVLGQLDARQVVAELGADAILLCWEGPGRFCHRRLVAEWIERETGVVVPEWTGVEVTA
jgi:hypothetical protein